MTLWKVNFQELYQRHLCRHSQFGINVSHLATFVGTYLGLFALARMCVPEDHRYYLMLIPIPYFVMLARNVPVRVLIATIAFVALFFAGFFAIPRCPVELAWAPILLIVLCHQAQNWSHRYWNVERDMTEFKRKYHKGLLLFVVLLLYELPIQLNYLLFEGDSAPAASRVSPAQEAAVTNGTPEAARDEPMATSAPAQPG